MTNFDFSARLVEVCARKGLTIGTAESCTGGGVAEAITAVSGSSSAFVGGFVTYTNNLKMDLLGVPAEVIDTETEVSHACARAMACGARERLGVTIAISTTGYAGPTGATKRDPVGTVYIGIATAKDCFSERFSAPRGANREEVRRTATERALELALQVAELL
jgi:PncC family amidohydrolase